MTSFSRQLDVALVLVDFGIESTVNGSVHGGRDTLLAQETVGLCVALE